MHHKKKGFFILEVLFAILIISGAMIGVFTILKRTFIVIGKIKKDSVAIFYAPLVYSAYSPMIYKHCQNKDCTTCFSELIKVDFVETNEINKNTKMNIENVYAGKKNITTHDIELVYSNAILVLPDDKEKNKGEEVI